MTTLREAATMALEACTDVVSGWESLAPLSVRRAAVESLDALRAALAEPVQKNDWLPPHKCGLQLIHNEHKDVYEELEDHYHPDDFVSPEEWDKAVRENSVWTLQWYPETPVGFHRITASSLEAIQQALKENKYD